MWPRAGSPCPVVITPKTSSITTPKWQPHAFRQLLCHPLCAQKQIEVATQTAPRASKALERTLLIFHRYSTELFRGWTCLLDFCKHLANMGLWKIVNVSAFGKPDAAKIRNVSGFLKNRCSTRCSSYIYICVFLYFLCFMFHTMFHIYIYIAKTSMGVNLMFHKGPSPEARGHVFLWN